MPATSFRSGLKMRYISVLRTMKQLWTPLGISLVSAMSQLCVQRGCASLCRLAVTQGPFCRSLKLARSTLVWNLLT